MNRKLRMGMIGGGIGAFIGDVHRKAAQFSGQAELVAGAFSTDAERSYQTGEQLYLPKERCYASYQEMLEKEAALPEDQRVDFISIVTPNHMHFPIAKACLEAGFHVMLEKPLTMNLEEALELRKIVEKSGLAFALMHNYTGYPMVKQAKAMCESGILGEIRKIVVEYSLGWLASPNAGKQAVWRVDPKFAGISGCMADIGTHAQNLITYITGLGIKELCCDLTSFVEGRELDDDGSVMMRFDNGARGAIFASEVSTGQENNFRIYIYGSEGALEWQQESPENLIFRSNTQAMRIYRRGWAEVGEEAQAASYLPAGHPEGFFEAFSVVYNNFIEYIKGKAAGKENLPMDFPSIEDGVEEMIFLDCLVKNSNGNEKWTQVPKL